MNDSNSISANGIAAPDVKIIEVEVIPLAVPFKWPIQNAGIKTAMDALPSTIIKVHTDAGVYGVGETQAWKRQGSAEDQTNQVRILKEYFAPLIVGKSPFDIAAIMTDLNKTLHHSYYCQAPVSDALYDVCGRILGVPVYDLLGGKCRDTAPCSCTLILKKTNDETFENAKEHMERGFKHQSIKIGLTPDIDFQNVKMLREHFGDEIEIRVDANASMNYEQAVQTLGRLEPFNLELVEQPVPIWDVDGLAALSASVSMPIIADESVSDDHDLLDVIKKRAATGFQTKISKNGGIYYIRKLFTLASAAGLSIYPGNHPTTSIGTAAILHLCAAWPEPIKPGNVATGINSSLADDIVVKSVRVENAAAYIPDGPGFGIELDDDKVEKYTIEL
ncbi:MAG: hypothetical protein CMM28_02750 [Rhodospirillaceae bacterium]|nr:hypothetical protein [Rhodospirillaceae bacterium]|tara:strand:- start:3926 stop:5095 length:1170 start_codon:yes stop_codon:yes gene_type:complete